MLLLNNEQVAYLGPISIYVSRQELELSTHARQELELSTHARQELELSTHARQELELSTQCFQNPNIQYRL